MNNFLSLPDLFFKTPESILTTIFEDGFFESSSKEIKSSFDKESGVYSVWILAPGFADEEISVEHKEDKLKISGNLKNEETIKKTGDQNFDYVIYQKGIDIKSITATIQNGILEITYKLLPENTPKKIAVKSI